MKVFIEVIKRVKGIKIEEADSLYAKKGKDIKENSLGFAQITIYRITGSL